MRIFALDVAGSVGVFDPDGESFQLIDIPAQLSCDFKFAGAALTANGLIIVAPDLADRRGCLRPCVFRPAPVSAPVSFDRRLRLRLRLSTGAWVFVFCFQGSIFSWGASGRPCDR